MYQRVQYAKGGVGRRYWDYRDKVALSFVLERHRRIADLGCGEGITLEKMAKKFPEKDFLGVDLSQENIAICKSFGLDAVYASLYQLPLADRSFDLCLLLEVLEHMDKPEQAVKEAFRVLSDEGRLVMVTPHDRNFLFARLATLKIKEAFYDPGHVRRWRPTELRKLLAKCGFKVTFEKNIPFFFWQTSLHHLVVAEKVPAAPKGLESELAGA